MMFNLKEANSCQHLKQNLLEISSWEPYIYSRNAGILKDLDANEQFAKEIAKTLIKKLNDGYHSQYDRIAKNFIEQTNDYRKKKSTAEYHVRMQGVRRNPSLWLVVWLEGVFKGIVMIAAFGLPILWMAAPEIALPVTILVAVIMAISLIMAYRENGPIFPESVSAQVSQEYKKQLEDIYKSCDIDKPVEQGVEMSNMKNSIIMAR